MIMKRDTTIWQVEGNTVFKLKETGSVERIEGKFVPEVTNDYLFNVQHRCVRDSDGGNGEASRLVIIADVE
jgi:hypothetical protein